jgi:hypothetical protein
MDRGGFEKEECMNGLSVQDHRRAPVTIGALMLAALFPPSAAALAVDEFTTDFRIVDCKFKTVGSNPYFILKPGRRLVYEGDGGRLLITVLPQTRRITLEIDGKSRTVNTRIVEEREFEDGELIEVSRNFFAICSKTNDVFYFGEEVDIYEDCEIVTHEGAWLAGQDGAQPGIIMPGTFLLGARYFQEIAPNVAMDRAENVEMGLTVDTPFGELENCVRVIETTPLEAGTSEKIYAPGIGLVVDGDLELVDVIEHVTGKDRKDDDCEGGGDEENGEEE